MSIPFLFKWQLRDVANTNKLEKKPTKMHLSDTVVMVVVLLCALDERRYRVQDKRRLLSLSLRSRRS